MELKRDRAKYLLETNKTNKHDKTVALSALRKGARVECYKTSTISATCVNTGTGDEICCSRRTARGVTSTASNRPAQKQADQCHPEKKHKSRRQIPGSKLNMSHRLTGRSAPQRPLDRRRPRLALAFFILSDELSLPIRARSKTTRNQASGDRRARASVRC